MNSGIYYQANTTQRKGEMRSLSPNPHNNALEFYMS